jgi:hypothetical protein
MLGGNPLLQLDRDGDRYVTAKVWSLFNTMDEGKDEEAKKTRNLGPV